MGGFLFYLPLLQSFIFTVSLKPNPELRVLFVYLMDSLFIQAVLYRNRFHVETLFLSQSNGSTDVVFGCSEVYCFLYTSFQCFLAMTCLVYLVLWSLASCFPLGSAILVLRWYT